MNQNDIKEKYRVRITQTRTGGDEWNYSNAYAIEKLHTKKTWWGKKLSSGTVLI